MIALEALAKMPLLTGEELAAVCRKDRAWSSRALNGLRGEKLIEGTWYNLEGYGAMRWRLTELGVNTLAGWWKKPVRELLRRWPLSAEWEQSLLRRVQTVAVCHRIALDTSRLQETSLSWRWERSDVFDAFMGLEDGRTVGICRMGKALSAKAIASRMNSVQLLHDLRQVLGSLIVVPGLIEQERVVRRLAGAGANVAVGIESELSSGTRDMWRMTLRPSSGNVSTRDFISSLLVSGFPERHREPVRAAPPRSNGVRGVDAAELLMSRISHNGANLFDLISDWPLMQEQVAQEMLNVGDRRFAEMKREVVGSGIVASLKFPALRRGNGILTPASRRMALTNDGLRQVAWRDRVTLSELLKSWKIFEDPNGHAGPRVNGYRLEGRKLRMLARELKHTDSVHGIIQALHSECAASASHEVVEVLPPHRWERWFYYNRRRYGIMPDATALVKCNGIRHAWLIEFEQRASTPKLMAEKMQRYVRYFGSLDTGQDFEVAPVALVVYPDRGSAARFAVTARRSVDRSRFGRNPRLRILVSSVEDIQRDRFMGPCWLDPWNMDAGTVTPASRRGTYERIGE